MNKPKPQKIRGKKENSHATIDQITIERLYHHKMMSPWYAEGN